MPGLSWFLLIFISLVFFPFSDGEGQAKSNGYRRLAVEGGHGGNERPPCRLRSIALLLFGEVAIAELLSIETVALLQRGAPHTIRAVKTSTMTVLMSLTHYRVALCRYRIVADTMMLA